MKHPKNMTGFDDFIQKINEMGLSNLILQKAPKVREKLSKLSGTGPNWWYLG